MFLLKFIVLFALYLSVSEAQFGSGIFNPTGLAIFASDELRKILGIIIKNENDCDGSARSPADLRQCTIRVDSRMDGGYAYWPLVLHPTRSEFMNVNANGEIVLGHCDELRLACTGDRNSFVKFTKVSVKIRTIQCDEGTKFFYDGKKSEEFNQFYCKSTPESKHIIPYGRDNEIQFILPDGSFIPLISVRLNTFIINGKTISYPAYATHTIHQAIRNGQRTGGDARTDFRQGDFPVDHVDNLYTKRSVNDAMDNLIGPANRNLYFDNTMNYFARGHLAAQADFIYYSQRFATFYHINCSPQFQGFNMRNWHSLEDSIQRTNFGEDISVKTGIIPTLRLPNANEIWTDLYLTKANQGILVPLAFYKIIRTPSGRQYNFTGYNFPNKNYNTPPVTNCRDECANGEYDWLNPILRNQNNRRNFDKGYLVCCVDPRYL